MTDNEAILIEVLASTDAVFLPTRDPMAARWSNAWSGRRLYQRAGTPIGCGADTDAGRKSRQRAVHALAADGRLTPPATVKGSRSLHVRLSDFEDWRLRSLCGLPPPDATWWAMRQVADKTKPDASTIRERWCPENAIVELTKPALTGLEDALLPALTRGLVVSLSDGRRLVSYAMTPAGWAAVDTDPPTAKRTKRDTDAAASYMDALLTALSALDLPGQRAGRDVGPVPLPCSCDDVELGVWRV